MKLLSLRNLCVLCVSAVILAAPINNHRDAENAEVAQRNHLEFDTPDFKLKLVEASQTVAALEPKSAAGFDFTPGDRLEKRAANGYHHLGDLTLRIRVGTSGPWQKYDTAESRKPVEPLTPSGTTLAAADLPADIPLQITRSWLVDNGHLVLRFELKNKATQPVQLGVRITLSPANAFTPNARLRVQQPAKLPGVGIYVPRQKFVNERDAFTIPLGRSPISIELGV